MTDLERYLHSTIVALLRENKPSDVERITPKVAEASIAMHLNGIKNLGPLSLGLALHGVAKMNWERIAKEVNR